MKPKNNFKRNHLINLIIRFISKDNLYISVRDVIIFIKEMEEKRGNVL